MRSKICLWATLLSLLPIISYAQSRNNSPVQELYVKSGIEKQLGELPSVIQAIFDQSVQANDHARKLPKDVLSTMRAAILQSFAPEKLQKTMLEELTEKLTVQDTKQILQ